MPLIETKIKVHGWCCRDELCMGKCESLTACQVKIQPQTQSSTLEPKPLCHRLTEATSVCGQIESPRGKSNGNGEEGGNPRRGNTGLANEPRGRKRK